MVVRSLTLTLLVLTAFSLPGADVTGSVDIVHKLTKKKVTPTASAYAQGTTVELGTTPPVDLSFERTHVVVFLEGNLPTAAKTAKMEQEGRQFVPDLVVVPVGSTVSFPNMDTIFHNVFSLSKPKKFDLGNYPKGQTREVNFPMPGIVYVYCHLHSNMTGSIVVTPNRFVTTAEPSGKFVLTGVPPRQVHGGRMAQGSRVFSGIH